MGQNFFRFLGKIPVDGGNFARYKVFIKAGTPAENGVRLMAITMTQIQAALSKQSNLYKGIAHALGSDASKWAEEAGMDWTIKSSKVYYKTDDGKMWQDAGKTMLYRSDDEEPLAVVSHRFKPVQPAQVIRFFGDLSNRFGFKLELAGQGSGGRKIWGLASTPLSFGKGSEEISNYLMLSTANDGTMATKGFFTTFRLFCTNQLPMMVELMHGQRVGSIGRVSHIREFSTERMAKSINALEQQWGDFTANIDKLQHTKVSDKVARDYLMKLHFKGNDDLPAWSELRPNAVPVKMFDTYKDDPTNKPIYGTAWGLVNSVTRYLDHGGKANNGEARIDRVWLGQGRKVKEDAFNMALELTAKK